MAKINDITLLLKKGLDKKSFDVCNKISKEIFLLKNECALLDPDFNRLWYEIGSYDKVRHSFLKRHGLLCSEYPVAIIFKNEMMSDEYIDNSSENYSEIVNAFDHYGIGYINIDSRIVSCNSNILINYCDNKCIHFIDDRFLYDDNLPFNYEAYDLIDSGVNYINPYNFDVMRLLEI